MICDHWDVVAVPFPFMERPALKRRPALVISTKDFNAKNDHSVFAMITAAMLESWPSDYRISKPKDAGLAIDCFIRWKIFTLPNNMIAKRIGELADEDREEVARMARTIFVRS
jgi:mRNA interferase MazF